MSTRKARLLVLALTLMGLRPMLAQQPFALDVDFRTEIDTWYVSSIAPLPDGDVLLSGQIRFPGDPIGTFRLLARVDANGQRQEWFPYGYGGGKLVPWANRFYVGNNQIVRRVWPDGTTDTEFIGMNLGPYFSSLQGGDYHVYPDGRVLMSGVHNLSDTVRGFTGLHCLVWFSNTGYLDTTQHHRKCLGSLNVFQQLPDGRFIGSGSTGTWDGQPASNIIRFHPDGELDTTFQAQVWWGQAYDFLPLEDGRMYAAGLFRISGMADTLHVVRFMPDGSLDPTFHNTVKFRALGMTTMPMGAIVRSIMALDTGRLVVTGNFDQVEGQSHGCIAMLDTNGYLLNDAFTGNGAGTFTFQGATGAGISGLIHAGNDQWYIWGAYHGYDDGNTNDPQQRMVSRLHGLGVGVQEWVPPGVQALLHIHPNPASTWVAIDYDLLVEPKQAALVVRDIAGRELYRKALHNQRHQLVWDTRQVAPGTYAATLYNGQRALRTEKIVLQP